MAVGVFRSGMHRAGVEPAGPRFLAWYVFQFHHLCIKQCAGRDLNPQNTGSESEMSASCITCARKRKKVFLVIPAGFEPALPP